MGEKEKAFLTGTRTKSRSKNKHLRVEGEKNDDFFVFSILDGREKEFFS